MFELKEIMRQRESTQFAELLNRLREGKQTNEDIRILKQRILQPSGSNYPVDAPRLFIQNAKVNDFNDKVHQASQGTKYNIRAHGSVIGATFQEVRYRIL